MQECQHNNIGKAKTVKNNFKQVNTCIQMLISVLEYLSTFLHLQRIIKYSLMCKKIQHIQNRS